MVTFAVLKIKSGEYWHVQRKVQNPRGSNYQHAAPKKCPVMISREQTDLSLPAIRWAQVSLSQKLEGSIHNIINLFDLSEQWRASIQSAWLGDRNDDTKLIPNLTNSPRIVHVQHGMLNLFNNNYPAPPQQKPSRSDPRSNCTDHISE